MSMYKRLTHLLWSSFRTACTPAHWTQHRKCRYTNTHSLITARDCVRCSHYHDSDHVIMELTSYLAISKSTNIYSVPKLIPCHSDPEHDNTSPIKMLRTPFVECTDSWTSGMVSNVTHCTKHCLLHAQTTEHDASPPMYSLKHPMNGHHLHEPPNI